MRRRMLRLRRLGKGVERRPSFQTGFGGVTIQENGGGSDVPLDRFPPDAIRTLAMAALL
jgi:hypothetical protein